MNEKGNSKAGRKPQLTYEMVVQAAERLILEGRDPSSRLVRDKVGVGSPQTILDYLARWQREKALASTVTEGISDEFKQAFLAEIGRNIQTVRERYEQQLKTERSLVDDAQAIIRGQESQLETLTNELENATEQLSQCQLELKKQVAVFEERQKDYVKQLSDIKVELEKVKEERHHAQMAAAVNETRCQELQKQNIKLELQQQANPKNK